MLKQFSAAYPRLAPFLYGFTGWFLFNTVVWIPIFILSVTVFAPDPTVEGFNQLYIIPFCFIPGLLNVGILIFLLVKRRWSALGWIFASLVNLGIYSLMAATYFNDAFSGLVIFLAAFFGFPFYFILAWVVLV